MTEQRDDDELDIDAMFDDEPDVSAQLGMAAAPVQPPPSMKADLFAKLDATPQNPADESVRDGTPRAETQRADFPGAVGEPSAGAESRAGQDAGGERERARTASDPAQDQVQGASGPTDDRAGEASGPAQQRAQRRWFLTPARAAVAVAAAVVIAVGMFFAGGAVFGGFGGDDAPRDEASGELTQILAAPDVAHDLAEVTGGGTVTVYWSAELGRSAIVADGLTPLPDTNDYELWYIDDEGPAKAGLLAPAAEGPTWQVLEGTFEPGVTIGLTVEPAGGSDEPTTDPIAVIESR